MPVAEVLTARECFIVIVSDHGKHHLATQSMTVQHRTPSSDHVALSHRDRREKGAVNVCDEKWPNLLDSCPN